MSRFFTGHFVHEPWCHCQQDSSHFHVKHNIRYHAIFTLKYKSDITTQYVCWKEALFLPPISSSHCRLTALLLTNFFFLSDGPFLWVGFNCLKAIETLQGEFIFYHYILPTNFCGLNILLCKYTRLNVCVCHQKIAFATWVVIY